MGDDGHLRTEGGVNRKGGGAQLQLVQVGVSLVQVCETTSM